MLTFRTQHQHFHSQLFHMYGYDGRIFPAYALGGDVAGDLANNLLEWALRIPVLSEPPPDCS